MRLGSFVVNTTKSITQKQHRHARHQSCSACRIANRQGKGSPRGEGTEEIGLHKGQGLVVHKRHHGFLVIQCVLTHNLKKKGKKGKKEIMQVQM